MVQSVSETQDVTGEVPLRDCPCFRVHARILLILYETGIHHWRSDIYDPPNGELYKIQLQAAILEEMVIKYYSRVHPDPNWAPIDLLFGGACETKYDLTPMQSLFDNQTVN